MRYTLVIGLLVALGLPAPALAQASGATRQGVEATVRAYVTARNRADAGAIAALYSTQPGVTLVTGGEVVRGWDRIRERVGVMDSVTTVRQHVTLTLGSLDVTDLGKDYALAIVPYMLTAGVQGTDVRERGAMTFVLRKMGKDWKIIHDHTSARPQPAAVARAPAPAPAPAAAAPAGAPAAGQLVMPSRVAPSAGSLIPIVDGTALEIPPQQVVHYDFQIPPGVCTVTGRVQGISGGDRSFKVLIVDDANYHNWSAGLETKAYGSTGRVTMTTINSPIPGPGMFHLIISNAFSAETPKTVQVWAQVQCP